MPLLDPAGREHGVHIPSAFKYMASTTPAPNMNPKNAPLVLDRPELWKPGVQPLAYSQRASAAPPGDTRVCLPGLGDGVRRNKNNGGALFPEIQIAANNEANIPNCTVSTYKHPK